jgi:hypothetical protein
MSFPNTDFFKRTKKFTVSDGAKSEVMTRTVEFVPNATVLTVSNVQQSKKEGEGVYRSAQIRLGHGRTATLIGYGAMANSLNRLRTNTLYSFEGKRVFNTRNPMMIVEAIITQPISVDAYVEPVEEALDHVEVYEPEFVGESL